VLCRSVISSSRPFSPSNSSSKARAIAAAANSLKAAADEGERGREQNVNHGVAHVVLMGVADAIESLQGGLVTTDDI
jgi:hypothetical protein